MQDLFGVQINEHEFQGLDEGQVVLIFHFFLQPVLQGLHFELGLDHSLLLDLAELLFLVHLEELLVPFLALLLELVEVLLFGNDLVVRVDD